jgi:hypothetical protein
MAASAMFEGLVFDETGEPAGVTTIGDEAFYVVLDAHFRRHIPAAEVDVQVLRFMRGQVEGQRGAAVEAMMQMLGKDDLFTKAAVESSINNMEQAVGNPVPAEARQWLGILGFRIVVDFHGTVVDIALPGAPGGEGEE